MPACGGPDKKPAYNRIVYVCLLVEVQTAKSHIQANALCAILSTFGSWPLQFGQGLMLHIAILPGLT